MALIYRAIDPCSFDEAYTANLFSEYAWRDSSNTYVADSEDERRRKTDALIANLLGSDHNFHCVAAFDGAVMVGAITLCRMIIDKRPACHIQGLWIRPDYRRDGVAKNLKLLAEDWARSIGALFMDSNVRVENENMINLNRKLGYQVLRLNFRKFLD